MKLKQMFEEAAYEAGIDIVGVTAVTDYGYIKEFFTDRKNNAFNNELEEQDISKRLNVRSIFPACKSIIAIGATYGEGYKKPDGLNCGLISVSSYGLDYHIKLRGILSDISEKVKAKKFFNYKICVDTTPLIDKEICKNAGVGTYGKNSLLINEEMGSFIFLGYILTDLEAEEESVANPEKKGDCCSGCNICVKSCPNNAILGDGRLDSKRCVSYLTQTKTYIPVEFRKNMKNQIYGCDICQLVCPQNKKTLQKETANNYNELLVDLNELMTISNRDFSKKYGSIAGGWRGRNVWKRNGIIAIANLEIKSMFDVVCEELKNPSDMIKIYAAWALLRLNKVRASNILFDYFKLESGIIKEEYKRLLEEGLP